MGEGQAPGALPGPSAEMAGEGTCTVLLVEDDADICELVSFYLSSNAVNVLIATGWDALDVIANCPVDLVLLDIMLQDANGFDICKEIRERTDIPVLFVSAKSEEADKIEGLGVGGDDYICKPFSPAELLARVHAHLRRYRGLGEKNVGRKSGPLALSDLMVDEERLIVKTPVREVSLSIKEFQLLLALGQNPHKVFTPEELFSQVWKTPSLGDARTVMVHISNLRKKIEEDPTNPRYILTVRGTGYTFQAEGAV
ncbi:MAG: response regulator transcription factor [Firmicutes bacterium]|nr:response regulator transcription factor [Bacillota bacterium]